MKVNLLVLALFLSQSSCKKLKKVEDPDLKDYQDDSDYICDGDLVQGDVSDLNVAEYSEIEKDRAEGA